MREPFQGGWHKCPVCGKRFRIPAETAAWTYTIRQKGRLVYICSWGCVRVIEKGGKAGAGKTEGTA